MPVTYLQVNLAAVKQIIRDNDINGDDQIEYLEFLNVMAPGANDERWAWPGETHPAQRALVRSAQGREEERNEAEAQPLR